MILTDYFYPNHSLGWDYAKACGVEHATLRLPETDDFDITNKSHWQSVVNRLISFGVRPIVIEPMPDRVHNHIKLGGPKRDQSISEVIRMLGVMDELDIRIICFNFMAAVGWTRTSSRIEERGGVFVTGFNLDEFIPADAEISESALWDNYTYFLRAVLPHAEKHGIHLALHPDDPPISPLGKLGRIMTSYNNIRQAMDIVPSDCLGVTFCQATYHLMGEDIFKTATMLRDKIRFIHFRNVRGNKNNFRETLHDNGELPMAELICMYKDLGLNVPIRVDHVPTMAGVRDDAPAGYEATGKLFAIGYLKGLLEAILL